MSCLLQMWSILVFMYWVNVSSGTPIFQGFSVNKGFEVNFKPFQFKPLTLFREKWSPFGMYGVRKGIAKRDLGNNREVSGARMPSPIVSPAPVFEHIEEQKPEEAREKLETSGTTLRLSPDPVKPLFSNFISIPLSENKPPTEGLFTNIGREVSAVNNYVLQNPAQSELKGLYGELPPKPVGPIPAQTGGFNPQSVNPQTFGFIPAQPVSPISPQLPGVFSSQPVSPIPPQPLGIFSAQPVNPSFTQSFRVLPEQGGVPISASFPNEAVTIITPPPGPMAGAANVPFSEIPPTEGPIVKGSRLALYYGNIFLQLVSQFLTNARLQFSRSSPLPKITSQ